MTQITGIGGFFFRAKEPKAMAVWYETHLGISQVPQDAEGMPWMQEAGPTVFAPFSADTDYFPPSQTAMINFRVRDLDVLVAQLTSAGIEIASTEEMEGIGRFAHIIDPEGNRIELWEPVAG